MGQILKAHLELGGRRKMRFIFAISGSLSVEFRRLHSEKSRESKRITSDWTLYGTMAQGCIKDRHPRKH